MIYELIYILSPKLTEEKAKAKSAEVIKSLGDLIGKVNKEEFWGKRVLAYPIKHFQEGIYIFIEFETSPDKIVEIDKKLKLDEKIIRFLIVKKDERIEAERKEKEKREETRIKEKEIKIKEEKKKKAKPEDLDKKIDKIIKGGIED